MHVVAIVFCLVSEEAATITNNHGLTADDFQQTCVVANVDSTSFQPEFAYGRTQMYL